MRYEEMTKCLRCKELYFGPPMSYIMIKSPMCEKCGALAINLVSTIGRAKWVGKWWNPLTWSWVKEERVRG